MRHITLSDRPFSGQLTAEQCSEASIDMCRILFRTEFVNDHCVIPGNVNVNSLLIWDGTMTRALRADARAVIKTTMSMRAVVHCGANFILHAAGGRVAGCGDPGQPAVEKTAGRA